MGGQGVALPRAARVVAYSARRDGEAGEVRSDAAKARTRGARGDDAQVGGARGGQARREVSMSRRCASCEGYSEARVG
ncbi:hypothetical protein SF23_18405 [Streptomyces sp. MBRL 10]|nr:hypothetical protein SF23_18405 [Streptomyces sp. MBRL 10]